MKKRIHLTEGQFHRLIEQALNELDWKTYDWAAKQAKDAEAAFRGYDDVRFGDLSCYPNYSDPLVRRAIIHTLSKKCGRKNVIPFINGMSDDQLEDFMNDLRENPKVLSDLWHRQDNFLKARTNAFAKKYGHKVLNPDLEDYETEDEEGNIWDMDTYSVRPSIYRNDKEKKRATISDNNPFTGQHTAEPYWDINTYDNKKKEDKEYADKLTQSDAAQDLLNNYAGNYEYVKGKGWQLKQKNESLARRVSESVIRKLRRA